MNNPEYILVDELEVIAAATKTSLGISVLNYQYGYVEELNETLKQYENEPALFDKKLPLIYVAEPYETEHGEAGIFGKADPDIYIFASTQKVYKARDRMEQVYKPIIFPIYREFLKQIVLSVVFDHTSVETLKHKTAKGYYWDKEQKLFNDAVDCLRIKGLDLRIHDNYCSPSKSF